MKLEIAADGLEAISGQFEIGGIQVESDQLAAGGDTFEQLGGVSA
jgi:hypothetical protein